MEAQKLLPNDDAVVKEAMRALGFVFRDMERHANDGGPVDGDWFANRLGEMRQTALVYEAELLGMDPVEFCCGWQEA